MGKTLLKTRFAGFPLHVVLSNQIKSGHASAWMRVKVCVSFMLRPPSYASFNKDDYLTSLSDLHRGLRASCARHSPRSRMHHYRSGRAETFFSRGKCHCFNQTARTRTEPPRMRMEHWTTPDSGQLLSSRVLTLSQQRLVSSLDESPMQRSREGRFSGLIDLRENDRHRRTLPRGRLIACHTSRDVVLDVYLLDGAA